MSDTTEMVALPFSAREMKALRAEIERVNDRQYSDIQKIRDPKKRDEAYHAYLDDASYALCYPDECGYEITKKVLKESPEHILALKELELERRLDTVTGQEASEAFWNAAKKLAFVGAGAALAVVSGGSALLIAGGVGCAATGLLMPANSDSSKGTEIAQLQQQLEVVAQELAGSSKAKSKAPPQTQHEHKIEPPSRTPVVPKQERQLAAGRS